jgi:hypothetical protein
MSKSEIAQALGHKSISRKLNMGVNELLENEIIESTLKILKTACRNIG